MTRKNSSKKSRPRRIKIVVAHDNPVVRLGLRTCLEKHEDIRVIAEAGDSEEAIELAGNLQPDIIIASTRLPETNIMDVIGNIVKESPDTKIVLVTHSVETENGHLPEMVNGYISGFLFAAFPLDLIPHAIRRVAAGDKISRTNMVKELFLKDSPITSSIILNEAELITAREKEMLQYIGNGLANKDIALKMGVTVPTVKANLTTIYTKLDVSCRTEAVLAALKVGILSLNDIHK